MNESSWSRNFMSHRFSGFHCLKVLLAIATLGAFTACGNLVNKQNSSPELKDPSKPGVDVPSDPEPSPEPTPAASPVPTPAPTPPAKCRRWMEQGGVYYEEQDNGEWATLDVPMFQSEDEEADFWRKKGGCGQPKPSPSPTPIATPAPSPVPTNTVRPSFYCKPDANGNFDTNATIMTGGNGNNPQAGGYVFGQGGGCVNRPLREVWAVAMNQPLMIWNGTGGGGSSVAPPNGVTKAFDVHYSVTRRYLGLPFTVTWEMNWFHTVQKGTPQDPEKILINYQRYHGTTHISYWEGSIVLQKVTEQITGVYIRNQIRADQTGVDGAKSGASDILEKYRTGQPALSELP